jgi:hypothetical protein
VSGPATTVDGAEPIRIGNARVVAGPVVPGHTDLMALSAILKDSSVYDWANAKGCKFNPDVAVRFEGHDTTLDVVFCFGCKELIVFKNGKQVGHEDFDRRAKPMNDLAALARSWFPDLDTR